VAGICLFGQDGSWGSIVVPGQVIAPSSDEEKPVLVLASLKWAVLTWPCLRVEGRLPGFQLKADAGCETHFIADLDAWGAWPVKLEWTDEHGILLQSIGAQESLPKNVLRFADKISYTDLGKLAKMSKLKKCGNKSRTELLRMLAEHFGGEHFVAVVLGQQEKTVKLDSGLIENVFEGMDDDERQEFRELQAKVKKAQKQSVQERWWKFLEEKKKEVQVPCHSVSVATLF